MLNTEALVSIIREDVGRNFVGENIRLEKCDLCLVGVEGNAIAI